jgi:hypothetical protein
MNFATQALALILTAGVVIVGVPILVHLFFTIGPIPFILITLALLVYFAR